MQFTNFNFSKSKKFYFKSILKMGFFLVFVLVGFSFYADYKIKEEISKIVGLQCEDIDVSILFRKANLNDIDYSWSDNKFDSSSVSCETVNLNGIKWWSLIFHKKLKINELHINTVKGNIEQFIIEKDTPSAKNKNTPRLNSIFINNIFLDKINIEYIKQKHSHTKIEDFNLKLNQFKYDLTQPLKAIKYEGFDCSLTNGSWIPEDGKYSIHFSHINGNMQDDSFLAKGLKLQPLQRKGKLNLNAPEIIGNGVDYKKLLNGNGLAMESLSIGNLDLKVNINKSKSKSKNKKPCVNCYKPFIHEMLFNVNFPITVEKVELKNNNIDIDVFNENKEQQAKVIFDKIYASIYNVTNEEEKIKNNPTATADVKTMFMGKEELNVKIDFDLDDKSNGYQVKADMENIDLTTMNGIFKFGTKASIKSGILKKLNFNIDGNQEVATGVMSFRYENLKVELFNDAKSKTKKVLSKIVNIIGIKKNNSASEGNFEKGKIYYERNRNKGIFHQWWRAIQSGFQSTIMPDILLSKELESDD